MTWALKNRRKVYLIDVAVYFILI